MLLQAPNSILNVTDDVMVTHKMNLSILKELLGEKRRTCRGVSSRGETSADGLAAHVSLSGGLETRKLTRTGDP